MIPDFEGTPLTERETRIARGAFDAAVKLCAARAHQWKWSVLESAAERFPLRGDER